MVSLKEQKTCSLVVIQFWLSVGVVNIVNFIHPVDVADADTVG